jgi:hypothetical protein
VAHVCHLRPGTNGIITAVCIFIALYLLAYLTRRPGPFNFDPQNVAGAFEPFLAKYLRLSEYIIGLATGSIVLLVGSSALHGQNGSLPSFYASPLLLLGFSVIYGVAFMVWLIFDYEDHRHGNPHTRSAYSLSLALGFSALACFCVGYVLLILHVTG